MKFYDIEKVKNFIKTLPKYELKDIYIDKVQLSKKFKAVCYLDTNIPVAIVSNKYKLVQHPTVFEIFLERLEKHFDNIEGFVQHTKTKAFLFAVVKEKFVEGDSNYKLGFCVSNSVDTTLAIWTSLFNYRVICSNGLVTPQTIMKIYQKHIGGEDFYNELKRRFDIAIQQFDNYQEREFQVYDILKEKTLTEDQIKAVIAKLELPQKALRVILTRIERVDSAFDLYQAITFYLSNYSRQNIASTVEKLRKTRTILEKI